MTTLWCVIGITRIFLWKNIKNFNFQFTDDDKATLPAEMFVPNQQRWLSLRARRPRRFAALCGNVNNVSVITWTPFVTSPWNLCLFSTFFLLHYGTVVAVRKKKYEVEWFRSVWCEPFHVNCSFMHKYCVNYDLIS